MLHLLRSHWPLGLILLLGFLVRMAGWETQDQKSPYAFYEPDEHQHLQLAQWQLSKLDSKLYEEKELPQHHFNARAYGHQLGALLWFASRKGSPPSNDTIIAWGRCLSTLFSLGLLLLVFLLGQQLFGRTVGLFAAFLIAINDLNVTYSHYAIPEAAYVFWLYLFVFSAWCYFQRQRLSTLALLFLSAAGVFATKFDFLPLVLALAIIAWPKIEHPGRLLFRLIGAVLASWFFFQLLCLFNFSWEELSYSWSELRRQNQNAVPLDNHWLHNPIVYLFGSIAALGLPVFMVALRSAWSWRWQWPNWNASKVNSLLVLLALLALEFGVRWSIDTPFIRRLNFLMPALALLAGYQLGQWWQQRRARLAIIGLLVYSLAFLLVSQSNHWQDPRYAARDFLQQEHPETPISYSGYAQSQGTPPSTKLEEAQLYVMHETYYRRYWKNFTTPFKIPQCCEEVYHCFHGPEVCQFTQELLAGTNTQFELEQAFLTKEFFLERLFYHHLFGHFETFRGDVLIFRRR